MTADLFFLSKAPRTVLHRCQQVSAERANLLKHYRAAGNLAQPHTFERRDLWVKGKDGEPWSHSVVRLEKLEDVPDVDLKFKQVQFFGGLVVEGEAS